jgi:hypothetical protein
MALVEDRRVNVDGKVEALPGPRVGVGLPKFDPATDEATFDDRSLYVESEEGHDIKFKTLTWKKVSCPELFG